MKVSELYAQVAQLGFEDSLDNDKRFLFALNRALYQLNSIRPHTSSIDVVHFPPRNLLSASGTNSFEAIMVEDGEYSVEASGGAIAYYFEVLGVGKLFIRLDGETANVIHFDSPNTLTARRGLIANPDGKNVSLTFASNNMMCLKSIALYAGLYAQSSDAIPAYAPYYRYDLSEMTEDFLALCSPPVIEANGNLPIYGNYDVDGNCLLLSEAIRGVYRVLYQRKLRQPDYTKKPSENGEAIDLDEELCSALPLLIGSYVWLEDEPERSAYYKNLYNERIAEIAQNKRDYKVTKIIDTNGW